MDDLTIKRIIKENLRFKKIIKEMEQDIDEIMKELEIKNEREKQILKDKLENLQLRKEEINLPFSQK
tara:strand:+ start:1621 stop:1821 length:201 start_codon:yes stop_codon:yes gene_type:complete